MFFLGPKCFSPALFNVQIFFKQKIHMSQHADGVNSGNVRWLGFQMWKCFLTEIRKRRTAILWRIILNSGSDLPLHKFVNHYFHYFPFFFASLLISIFDTSPTPWLYDHWWGLIHIVFGPFPHIGPHTYRHNETFCCYFLSLETNKRTRSNVCLAKKCHWPITYFDQLVRPLKLFTTGSTWRGGRLSLPSIM